MAAALLLPMQLSSQMPQLAKLIVRSVPNRGAAISINRQPTGQFTDAQFVVSPGDYTVSVSGTETCGASNQVTLRAGEAKTLTCNGTTQKWQ
jgi:hypothetical protein